MKNKVLVKILLDALMTVLYILLMFGYGISPIFHEVFGVIVGFLFAFHIWLNIPMLKALQHRVERSGNFSPDALMLILDILLIISMPVVIITGIMISKTLLNFNGGYTVVMLHNIASYAGLTAITAHLVLHMKYLSAAIKITARRFSDSSLRKTAGRFAAAVAAVAILYSITETVFGGNSGTKTAANDYPTSAYVVPSEDDQSLSQTGGDLTDTDEEKFTNTPSQQESTPTLNEYLGSLRCDGCGKHCSLLSPRCGKGEQRAETAQVEYEELFQIG